jgi:drug/metabolite transporter (DMT)-like permease
MIAAAFFFSLMSLCVKLAGRTMPTGQIVLARAAISLVITWVMLRQARVRPWGHNKRLLVLRGLAGFSGLLCFFYATTRLPLADVTVIHYVNPVLTTVFAAVAIGESVRGRDVFGLLLSLSGVVLVAQPSWLFGAGGSELDLATVGIALLGAVFSAVAYTAVRKLRETEHHLVVVFYFPLLATPAAIPLTMTHAVWPTPSGWLLLLGVGIATQIAQVYLTRGLHAERAGRAMSISYVQIVFAALWGAVVFGDRPNRWSLLGAVLVVLGTLVAARGRCLRCAPSALRSWGLPW